MYGFHNITFSCNKITIQNPEKMLLKFIRIEFSKKPEFTPVYTEDGDPFDRNILAVFRKVPSPPMATTRSGVLR